MTQYTARLTGAVPFNLQETFECGQCFRWLPGDDGSYTGVVGQNVITLRADGDGLLVCRSGSGRSRTAADPLSGAG